ncbi:MAG: prephenate dehydratase [Gemmatimonadetes bacterium]|nr:prephenate dehydratase [Gemmatimonadota bacterium]MCA9762823.1 prephenate dehydratase [Gemmatimonadota bacterium]MCB9504959.1 prephenate dehydratase [Gemmatimonadales bacterium]HPF61292.1 prephenate dehydratase domain-containing protein [Gemmatimonadales bacterium]HRX17536.1 prephenate dehydratase domain-containing protein [Gemmatimonadales bacterium]
MRIVYQGAPGAHSHAAAVGRRPEASPCGLPDFGAVAAEVGRGRAELGLLPIANTIVGPVPGALEVLAEWPDLAIIEQFEERITHVLAALPGADLASLRWAESHPVALAQCTRWLSARRLAPHAVEDTAGAARAIAADRDWTRAAICSAAAAERYGLVVLAHDIGDCPDNRTTFAVIARRAVSRELAA